MDHKQTDTNLNLYVPVPGAIVNGSVAFSGALPEVPIQVGIILGFCRLKESQSTFGALVTSV